MATFTRYDGPKNPSSASYSSSAQGNVLIAAHGRAVICDFGLCSVSPDKYAAAVSFRHDGRPRGRFTYIAPELLNEGSTRSCASDVFAFAVLAWEMYAGRPPFPERTAVMAILALSKGERPQRAAMPRADFSDALWVLVTACWSQAPAARPGMSTVLARLGGEMAAPQGWLAWLACSTFGAQARNHPVASQSFEWAVLVGFLTAVAGIWKLIRCTISFVS